MSKQAIVVCIGTDEDKTHNYFGPFANGDEATKWGFDNCKGFEWHWQEINPVNLTERQANKLVKKGN